MHLVPSSFLIEEARYRWHRIQLFKSARRNLRGDDLLVKGMSSNPLALLLAHANFHSEVVLHALVQPDYGKEPSFAASSLNHANQSTLVYCDAPKIRYSRHSHRKGMETSLQVDDDCDDRHAFKMCFVLDELLEVFRMRARMETYGVPSRDPSEKYIRIK